MNEINLPVQVVGGTEQLHEALRQVWAAATRAGAGGFVKITVNGEDVSTPDGTAPEPPPTRVEMRAAMGAMEDLRGIIDGLRGEVDTLRANARANADALRLENESNATLRAQLKTALEDAVALRAELEQLKTPAPVPEPVAEDTTATTPKRRR